MSGEVTMAELAALTGGDIVMGKPDAHFHALATDSRNISDGKSACFFAIKGRQHDGHLYIDKAYAAGVKCFVIETETVKGFYPDATFLKTSNSLRALQLLAANRRMVVQIPIFGITGSNGKTIVKEWLHRLLSPEHSVARNPRSYNSQIGVPLSVWGLRESDTLGIFEAGISQVGEMERLEKIIQPSHGIFTHLGKAHLENFNSQSELLTEKVKLFVNAQKVYFNHDLNELHLALETSGFRGEKCTWSEIDRRADLFVSRRNVALSHCDIDMRKGDDFVSLRLPFADRASFSNAMLCALILSDFGYDLNTIAERLERLSPIDMRMQRVKGINGSTVITDVWNNDLNALKIALAELGNISGTTRKVLILSDIHQSGIPPDELYEEVAQLTEQYQVDQFIGVGQTITAHSSRFEASSLFFNSTESLLANLEQINFTSSAILVKGASAFKFERLVQRIQLMSHSSVLEINMSRIVSNLNFYRNQIERPTKIMAMVKAFGYGAGSSEVAELLEFHGVDYLGVAYISEGQQLREAGIRTPIFVLNPDSSALSFLIESQLEPEIYSFRILEALIFELHARQYKEAYPVHLKIDTGMHRLGFLPEDLHRLTSLLKNEPLIKVVGVLSHFSAADQPQHDDFTREQIRRFKEAADLIELELECKVMRHICNTSGLLRFPEAHFELVRLGIGMYGIPSCEVDRGAILPAGSLKTRISQLRTIAKGESVGYARQSIADYERVIATLPVGYADGYPRHLSNGKGRAVINGHHASVVGNVCMDMIMLDVTGIDCREGDEAILFGDDPSLTEVAAAAGTIPYEIIAGISQRVHRTYVYE